MNRKSFVLAIAIVLVLLGSAATGLGLLVRHVPTFYERAAVPPGDARTTASGEFVSRFFHLIDGVANKRQWREQFTEKQINSYFVEDFLKEHGDKRPLPDSIHEPRVVLEPDKIRLAFRYGTGPWSTIVSIEVRVWLVPKEPNVVAFEFQAVHAGALPISAQSMLERIADAAEEQDLDPRWFRLSGHPVLVLRFQADRSTPTFQLQGLELRQGSLLVSGRSLDSTPQISAAAPPAEALPN